MKIIKLYLITLFSMIITIVCLVLAFAKHDMDLFIMADLILVPYTILCFCAYRKEYHETFDEWHI